MKRILFIALCMVMSLAAMAKAPNLNVEKLFDGSYNSNKSVSLHFSKSQGKYFRGFTVRSNAALVKKVETLFKKDCKKAASSQDFINAGQKYSSMKVVNNGQEINIGLSYEGSDDCYLFITGPTSAFE